MSREAKLREIESLLARVRVLETEIVREQEFPTWPPAYYTTYHVLAGCVLGIFAAATSLLFNVVGCMLTGQHPLQIIRVYLTFPLGADALTLADNSVTLAIGVCLYLATGMLLGVPFQLMLTRWFARESFSRRFVATTMLALGLWVFNYYVLLSWLQPLLFGGNWIVSMIPWWVAALTHLIFGWTVLLAQPWGVFTPYHRR
jgi:hypothetical protein